MTTKSSYKLSDEFIGQVAKLVQLALLTGTNVVDNLRLVHVETSDDGEVVLAAEYKDYFNASLSQMLDEVENLQTEMQNTVALA
jgi:hypothetical protein